MQGFNRYIPPTYDPAVHDTLNQAAGKKHALGVRARKLDQGILSKPLFMRVSRNSALKMDCPVVRFELPYNSQPSPYFRGLQLNIDSMVWFLQ